LIRAIVPFFIIHAYEYEIKSPPESKEIKTQDA